MRARNIKPRFFDNELLGELNPLTRLLFIGLWCLADREGRLEDRPKRIKKEILGYDDCDCDEMLDSLNSSGFILRYSVDENRYIQIINFTKHQKPHKNESESTIPPPCVEPRREVVTTKDVNTQADSFNLDTDCLNLNPERLNPKDSEAKASCRSSPTADVVREIIQHLNTKANTSYKPSGKATQRHINARLNEGYKLDDFIAVIDKKCAEWMNTDMAMYMRPETLFGTKFESYLNQPSKAPPKQGAQPRRNIYEELAEQAAKQERITRTPEVVYNDTC